MELFHKGGSPIDNGLPTGAGLANFHQLVKVKMLEDLLANLRWKLRNFLGGALIHDFQDISFYDAPLPNRTMLSTVYHVKEFHHL